MNRTRSPLNKALIATQSRWRPAIEALLPIVAAQAYIWSVPHERPRWLDVLCAAIITVLIVFAVVRNGPRTRRDFGLARGKDHKNALLPLTFLTGVAITIVLVYGWQTDQLRHDWDVLGAVVAYPVWGLLQQGLMFGFIYPRLRQATGVRLAPLLTALLFGALHTPNPLLMVGGTFMVLGYALIWERTPSLPLTAISHGIIGAVCDKGLHVSMRVGAHYFGT